MGFRRQNSAAGWVDAGRAEGLWPLMGRMVLRQSLPLGLALLLILSARSHLLALDWGEVFRTATRVGAGEWAVAVLATVVSFAALGQYDASVHRFLKTGVGRDAAARSGMAAIAISQMAGFGLLTGTLSRWHLLPRLSLAAAGRVTIAVTISFLLAWAVLTAATVLLLMPTDAPFRAPLALAGMATLGIAGLGFLGLILAPPLRVRGRNLTVPPLMTCLRILGLAAVDTLAAALVLYALLPDSAAPGFHIFLPAYLIALGAGLVLGTPGGIGPFEIALAALLPALGVEALAGALLCYRVIYFALPALIAGGLVLSGRLTDESEDKRAPAAAPLHLLRASVRAETGLWHQGMHEILNGRFGEGFWLTARAGQMQVTLLDPSRGAPATPALLGRLSAMARDRDLWPALYKIGPRSAVLARRAGWRLHAVAEECWLEPALFSPDTPARATLRRKLRQAAKSGLRITRHRPNDPAEPPFARMAEVSADWVRRRGGERGFSMGRFDPDYLAQQRLYLAWRGEDLVGFISLHDARDEWTLDLVRQTGAAPDGTIQTLIVAALGDAALARVPRLSLAAAPLPMLGLGGQIGALCERIAEREGAAGLRQFKAGFAPRTTRLYLAARSRPSLVWAAIEIARAVRWPAPLPSSPRKHERNSSPF